jgi:hypothetical protein
MQNFKYFKVNFVFAKVGGGHIMPSFKHCNVNFVQQQYAELA